MTEIAASRIDDSKPRVSVVPTQILGAFILVTTLFALWGFANDITNPMVAAFKNILLISNFESSLVQFAFYGGYCVMAIPAALFIKRFSYKAGILTGLLLYALGCLMFIPSGWMMAFWAFLLSYFVMTCGLSFLETSANPYILAMGPEETATRRLNFAQSFNPMGSLTGMLVARNLILARLDRTDGGRPAGDVAGKLRRISSPPIREHDLNVIIGPYLVLGLVVLARWSSSPSPGCRAARAKTTRHSTSARRSSVCWPTQVHRRRRRAGLLCRRSDHVLDVHHSVCRERTGPCPRRRRRCTTWSRWASS